MHGRSGFPLDQHPTFGGPSERTFQPKNVRIWTRPIVISIIVIHGIWIQQCDSFIAIMHPLQPQQEGSAIHCFDSARKFSSTFAVTIMPKLLFSFPKKNAHRSPVDNFGILHLKKKNTATGQLHSLRYWAPFFRRRDDHSIPSENGVRSPNHSMPYLFWIQTASWLEYYLSRREWWKKLPQIWHMRLWIQGCIL